MPTRPWLRLAELLITATLAIAILSAWRADPRDRAQLAADLAAAKQELAQADTRQHQRDAQLVQTLAPHTREARRPPPPRDRPLPPGGRAAEGGGPAARLRPLPRPGPAASAGRRRPRRIGRQGAATPQPGPPVPAFGATTHPNLSPS